MTTVTESPFEGGSPSPLPLLWRRKKVVKFLSVPLIVLSVLAIAFQVCAIVIKGKYGMVGGIWCGILYFATSVLALVAVRRDNKPMAIGLLWMAVASIVTSIALMTLAILSLTIGSETNKSWWIASNVILIIVGVLGLVISIGLTIAVGTSILKPEKQEHIPLSPPSETTERESTEKEVLPINPPIKEVIPLNELLTNIHPQLESASVASSGIYESIHSKQGSATGSIDQGEPTAPRPEPIYAIPIKKKKSSTHSNSTGDFDIQIDDRNESETQVNTLSSGHWFNMERPEEPAGSDVDDSQYTKNIELPKEDVIVHVPPPDTRSPVL